MKITTPDPLSSEERALATMLARVAPHGVPSPEIDASILSASHDAVAGNPARSRRPRWPVAMGLAASMVLAVGVAWQLRPAAPEVGGFDEVPVAARSSAEASSAAAATVTEVAASEPPDDAASAEAIEDSAAAPAPNKTLAPPGRRAAVVAAKEAAAAAVLPAPARALPAPATAPAPSYLPSSPPAPPAPPSAVAERSPTPSAGIQRPESARQADAAAATSEADSAAGTTTSARRELRVAPSSERMQETAAPAANGAARARRTELQVPVAADAQLQVGDWLERVRTRYGLGDEDAARRSLVLFVQENPTEPVPDDLEPLLDE